MQVVASVCHVVIADVVCVPVRGGFFFDDQAAIRAGAARDGFGYAGPARTPGFTRVRQPAAALSVLLVLDDGSVAVGDCAAVQYAGAAGRDPVFDPVAAAGVVEEVVAPMVRGAACDRFVPLAEAVEGCRVRGAPLHSAIRYGVSQAILGAVAAARRVTMAEVLRDEYRTGVELRPVALFAQCGDDRYDNVDKMILHGAGALPHGLVNSVAGKVGDRGELLLDYVRWVRRRVGELGGAGYRPVLHFDTYGTVGAAFAGDLDAVAGYLARLGEVAAPLALRIEHPVDAGSRDGQIEALAGLVARLEQRGSPVQVVADEWCNTLDDVRAFVAARAGHVVHVKMPDLGGLTNTVQALLAVRRAGLFAYCGGSATETDRSAQVSAHVAMACGADQLLAKPGMGVDEGMMIVGNEMARVAALAARRLPPDPAT